MAWAKSNPAVPGVRFFVSYDEKLMCAESTGIGNVPMIFTFQKMFERQIFAWDLLGTFMTFRHACRSVQLLDDDHMRIRGRKNNL